MATFRLTVEFNEEVQFVLMTYMSILKPELGLIPIAHLICTCIRWSATARTTEEENNRTSTVGRIWIQIDGPMQTLTLYADTGMRGQCALDWAQAMGVQLKFKAPRQNN